MRVARGYVKRLPPASFRLPPELVEALATEEKRTGETRTQIVERLLTKGLTMEKTPDNTITPEKISTPDDAKETGGDIVSLLEDLAEGAGWDKDSIAVFD